MTEDHGRASRSFFTKQRVNAVATQGSPSGLDSEEAALIQASYTNALGKVQPSQDSASRVMLLKDNDNHDNSSSGP